MFCIHFKVQHQHQGENEFNARVRSYWSNGVEVDNNNEDDNYEENENNRKLSETRIIII